MQILKAQNEEMQMIQRNHASSSFVEAGEKVKFGLEKTIAELSTRILSGGRTAA